MNEELNGIKSLSQEAQEMRVYFDKCPYGLKEYLKMYPKSSVDKYENKFNGDDRFSAIDMKIFFSSHSGTIGDSGCSRILCIENKDVFQEAFVEYLNTHRKEIFAYIAQCYENKIKESVKTIDDEIIKLNDIKKSIGL